MNGKRWTKGKKELKVDNTAQADKNGQPSRQTEDIRTNKIDGQKTDIKDKQNRLQMGRGRNQWMEKEGQKEGKGRQQRLKARQKDTENQTDKETWMDR